MALRTQNVAEMLEHFWSDQNKTYRSPELHLEQNKAQSMTHCKEEKTLQSRTGISLEVLIWLFMGPGWTIQHCNSYKAGGLVLHTQFLHLHYHSSHLYSTFPQLLAWRRQQNHPQASLFSLFVIFKRKRVSAIPIYFCSWHAYPCRN